MLFFQKFEKRSLLLKLMLLGLCLTSTVSAEPRSFLNFETGYRWDRTDNDAVYYIFDSVGFRTITPGQYGDRIQSYQVGGRGLWTGFLCDTYIRGSGHYGWILDGKFADNDTKLKGDLRGHTVDATGGVGYFFCMNDCWGVAPIAGYSYDKMHFKVKNSTFKYPNPSITAVDAKDSTANNTFQGPWVGFDLFFRPQCSYDFRLGYELHFAQWKNSQRPNGGTFPQEMLVNYPSNFNIHNYLLGPSHRKINDLLGHVFEFEGRYNVCECWSLGLDLKYTIYASKHHGKYHPDLPLNDIHQPARVAEARTTNVQWESFAALLSLNYEF